VNQVQLLMMVSQFMMETAEMAVPFTTMMMVN
jgi:hypothetical protein